MRRALYVSIKKVENEGMWCEELVQKYLFEDVKVVPRGSIYKDAQEACKAFENYCYQFSECISCPYKLNAGLVPCYFAFLYDHVEKPEF